MKLQDIVYHLTLMTFFREYHILTFLVTIFCFLEQKRLIDFLIEFGHSLFVFVFFDRVP